MSTDALIDTLTAALGSDSVTKDPERLAPLLHDERGR